MTDEEKQNSEAGLHNIMCQNVIFINVTVFHQRVNIKSFDFKYLCSIFHLNTAITENQYKMSYFI